MAAPSSTGGQHVVSWSDLTVVKARACGIWRKSTSMDLWCSSGFHFNQKIVIFVLCLESRLIKLAHPLSYQHTAPFSQLGCLFCFFFKAQEEQASEKSKKLLWKRAEDLKLRWLQAGGARRAQQFPALSGQLAATCRGALGCPCSGAAVLG